MFVCESLIFRSDSNGEDLEGYAGAGLYDSITLDTTETRKVDYGADRCAEARPAVWLCARTCSQLPCLRLPRCAELQDVRLHVGTCRRVALSATADLMPA